VSETDRETSQHRRDRMDPAETRQERLSGSLTPELPKSLEAMLQACWAAAQAHTQTYQEWRETWSDVNRR